MISSFGEISGSRGMERNIFYLISKSSYSTSSNPGWGITCRNDILLIHFPHGQGSIVFLFHSNLVVRWPHRIRYALDPMKKFFTGVDLDEFERTVGPILPSVEELGVPPMTGKLGCSVEGGGKRRIFPIGN